MNISNISPPNLPQNPKTPKPQNPTSMFIINKNEQTSRHFQSKRQNMGYLATEHTVRRQAPLRLKRRLLRSLHAQQWTEKALAQAFLDPLTNKQHTGAAYLSRLPNNVTLIHRLNSYACHFGPLSRFDLRCLKICTRVRISHFRCCCSDCPNP